MRVVTHNVNGIRAADRRGFRDWLARCDADVVALQEVRCRLDDLPDGVFGDYHVAYNPGHLAGRNGVALLTRETPDAVFAWAPTPHDVALLPPRWSSVILPEAGSRSLTGSATKASGLVTGSRRRRDDVPPGHAASGTIGEHDFAHEGRLVGVNLAGVPLTVVSVYVPKGGVPTEVAPSEGGREGYTPEQNQARYERKMDFLRQLSAQLESLREASELTGRHLLVLGDYNIAHGPADVCNWKTNLATEGFLPGERAWLDAAIGGTAPTAHRLEGRRIVAPTLDWTPHTRPLVDVVRRLHPDEDGPYSWWSWRGQAFAKDVGWRIDYHLASPGLAELATSAWVDRADDYDARISDHAPVVVDYSL